MLDIEIKKNLYKAFYDIHLPTFQTIIAAMSWQPDF
jgi:hypothetical protein